MSRSAVYDATSLMRRRLPLLLVVAALAVLVLYSVWPKRATDGRAVAELEPYSFANQLPLVQPPIAALAPSVLADPIERTVARIEWGPPDIFYWTTRHLPADRAALANRLMERFEKIVVGSPLLAQRQIDSLALLQDPSALRLLMQTAESPPANADVLQIAAIRAVAKYPRSDAIQDLLIRLSADPRSEVRHVAMQEVMRSDDLGDSDAMNGFLDEINDLQVLPFLQEVGRRKLLGCADAAARHLQAANRRIRQNAIFALLALGDERGRAAALEELASGDPTRVLEGVTLWRDAGALLPPEQARVLATNPVGEVRKQLAIALGSGVGTRADAAVDGLLTRLAADADPIVSQVAVEQLCRRGRRETLAPWIERLTSGYGTALTEAITFTCEILRDPAAARIVRGRLEDATLSGSDQANLLGGLKFVGGGEDAPRFIQRILHAGTTEDRRGSERTYLSEFAATDIQSLGGVVAKPLAEALAAAPVEERGPPTTLRAKLCLIDALRGVIKQADAAVARAIAEQLFAMIADESAPTELRIAAVDTIAYFDDAKLGTRLFDLRRTLADKTVADRILVLFASFF